MSLSELITHAEVSGPQKAALLLVRMGRERATAVLKNMNEEEAAAVLKEVAELPLVRSDVTDSVLEEAASTVKRYGAYGSNGYAIEIASELFGEQRALEMASRLAGVQAAPTAFPFLQNVPAKDIADHLADEHPQIVALVLAYLHSDQSAEVFAALPEEVRREASIRVCTMRTPTPEMIERAERSLEQKMAPVLDMIDAPIVGGVESLVTLLGRSDKETERAVLAELEQVNPELATEVRAKLFTFDHIAGLDKRHIQRVLRDVSQEDLILALKGASDAVVTAVKSNMSSNAVEILNEEMEVRGAVRAADAKEARTRILTTVRELEEAGEIAVQRSGDDLVA